MDQRVYLKVKIKSLAEEARIIRKEEGRAKKRLSIRHGLREHRIGIVRNEARHTNLAYGFLRGKTRQEIENGAKTEPNWAKVRAMVQKYGVDYSSFSSYEEGKKHLADTLRRFDDWTLLKEDKSCETS